LEKLENVEDFNKRIREAKYPDLDRCLYLWYSEQVRAKEAIILIREAWKMVSNQRIYNCWKKEGIIDCEEKEE